MLFPTALRCLPPARTTQGRQDPWISIVSMKKLPHETSELPNPRSFYLNPLPPQGFAHKEPKETLLKRAIGGEGEPAKPTQRTNQIPIPTRFAMLTSGRFPRCSEFRTPHLTLPQICKERTRGKPHHQTARKIATKPNHPQNPPRSRRVTHD